MTCRRLALAPVVALVFCALVGGPAASAAPSSTAPAEPTATSAANTKSSKKKKKRATVSSLDKRLKKTEKDLAAARRQLRLVQRATAGLVSGLDTIVGANGSVEALLGAGLSEVAAPELAKLESLLTGALATQAQQNANAVVVALQNPAVQPEVEKLLTSIFGVSPKTIGNVVANEQPVVFVRIGGTISNAVVGPELPDDLNSVSVSGNVVLSTTGGTVELLAGVRSGEKDTPAAKVVLDSLEAESSTPVSGSATQLSANHRVLAGNGTVFSLDAIDRASALGTTAGTVNIGQGAITVAAGTAVVRFTARFVDDSPSD